MIHSKLTTSFIIQTFDERNIESLSLRVHELVTEHFDDTSDVFSTFVSGEVNDKLEVLFIGVLFECDLLIEDKLVVGGWADLCGDGSVIELYVHFTWELDFHINADDVQIILIDFDFLLIG